MYCIDFDNKHIYLLIFGKNGFKLWLKLGKDIDFNIKRCI